VAEKKIIQYTPGFNINDVRKKYNVNRITKLSSNENPFISDKVARYITKYKHEINLYPESKPLNLAESVAQSLGRNISAKNIILGNGSNEILEFISRSMLDSSSEVIIPKHSFLVYEIISKLQKAKIITSKPDRNTNTDNYMGIDLESIKQKISKKTKLIFIANPANPTGTYIKISKIDEFIRSIPKNVSVVIDEAYYEYLNPSINPSAVTLIRKYNNLYVTRSFSKIFGLASLRIGYGVSNHKNIDKLMLYKQPFNTNLFAQKCAEIAMKDKKFIKISKTNNFSVISHITNLFDKLSISYLGTYCNFITFDVGPNSKKLFDYMLKNSIVLRPLDNYKLPNYLRVSIGTQNDMKKFSKALVSFYNEET